MIVTNEKRREVAAKVRDVMGELGQVELDGIPLADLIEPTECDECSTPNRFEELTAEIHEAYETLADALDRRLMPEGMEWPRYTDGTLVEIGDEVVGPDCGERINVDSVKFHSDGFTLYDSNGFDKWYEIDDRFERTVVACPMCGRRLERGQ